jgi:CRP-like cAMP-binding protein
MDSVKSRTTDREATLKKLALGIIGRVIWFRDCTQETLSELVACAHVREYGKGEPVARRDQSFDYIGMLIKGSLEASLTRPWGHRHLLGLLQPGDLIGLVPAMDGLGHVNDLWSRGPSAVLLVPGADLRRIRNADPMLGQALERHLAFRCRLLFDRLIADSGLSLEARLCSLLLTLCTLYGLPRDYGIELDMKLSQGDLADWLGVSRQRINFVVKKLEADGVIKLRYFAVTIVDPDTLATRAREPRSSAAEN